MSTLKVPGAHVYYEVTGEGPVLLLIPGAAGTGEVFRPLAPHLTQQYQVVTYDRRGFSQSLLDGPQDDEHRLATDADDARRLIESLSSQPIAVFGNSSGALVALEVLTRYPKQIQMVVAHEPPAVTLLPDAAQWLAFFDGVYDIYRKEGIPKAMQQFASNILGKVDQQVMENARRRYPHEDTVSNTTYWMEHELRKSPRAELDLDALKARGSQIVLACGHDSRHQMTCQPNKVLAGQLGRESVDFPGGHLGFLSHPALFAAALMNALGGPSR